MEFLIEKVMEFTQFYEEYFPFWDKLTKEDNSELFENIGIFYKMCHGYTHGNVPMSYPLLHYFEISLILYLTVLHTFNMLCDSLKIPREIDGIDASAKLEEYIKILVKQYEQKTTEKFDKHYAKKY